MKTNRERCSINFARALQFARKTNTYLFRWPTKYTKWEGKPPDNVDENEIIDNDPAFWELFVSNGPCYLTNTISKRRKFCNGTRAKYHSIILEQDQLQLFQHQARSGKTIITLDRPPVGVKVTMDEEKIVLCNLDLGTSKDPVTGRNVITVPILEGNTKNSTEMFVSSPNVLVGPSRVSLKETFPIRGAFAITVDKAQGQTLERVILALSRREHQLSNFTYACLYVGNSRVKKSEHLRILLKEEANPRLQWETLAYLTCLKPERSIKAFFAGFKTDRSNWKTDRWNKDTALDRFHI